MFIPEVSHIVLSGNRELKVWDNSICSLVKGAASVTAAQTWLTTCVLLLALPYLLHSLWHLFSPSFQVSHPSPPLHSSTPESAESPVCSCLTQFLHFRHLCLFTRDIRLLVPLRRDTSSLHKAVLCSVVWFWEKVLCSYFPTYWPVPFTPWTTAAQLPPTSPHWNCQFPGPLNALQWSVLLPWMKSPSCTALATLASLSHCVSLLYTVLPTPPSSCCSSNTVHFLVLPSAFLFIPLHSLPGVAYTKEPVLSYDSMSRGSLCIVISLLSHRHPGVKHFSVASAHCGLSSWPAGCGAVSAIALRLLHKNVTECRLGSDCIQACPLTGAWLQSKPLASESLAEVWKDCSFHSIHHWQFAAPVTGPRRNESNVSIVCKDCLRSQGWFIIHSLNRNNQEHRSTKTQWRVGQDFVTWSILCYNASCLFLFWFFPS